jgi:hypothetical protein
LRDCGSGTQCWVRRLTHSISISSNELGLPRVA